MSYLFDSVCRSWLWTIRQANELEEKTQKKMLQSSMNASFVHLPNSGHYIHMLRLDAVVIEAVRCVLGVQDR